MRKPSPPAAAPVPCTGSMPRRISLLTRNVNVPPDCGSPAGSVAGVDPDGAEVTDDESADADGSAGASAAVEPGLVAPAAVVGADVDSEADESSPPHAASTSAAMASEAPAMRN